MRGVEKLASVWRLYRTVVIDVCLFFLWSRRPFCNVFPFPVCKALLKGDWYENRQGAQNTIIFLIICQYIGAPMPPAPIVMADRTGKKDYWLTVPGQHCLLAEGHIGAPIVVAPGTLVRQYIGAGGIVAPIYWRTNVPRATTIGAPIPPALILMAHRTQKMDKNVRIQSP
jgi:hypothetical protein